jgi:mycothiol synthase
MIATLPGLRIRAFAGEADLPAVVEVFNAENEADGIAERETADGARAWFGNPSEQFDAGRDVAVAELDGRVIGVAGQDWIDTRDGVLREHRLWGAVHPSVRRRGVGHALLADNERRARALAAALPSNRQPALGAWAAVGRPGEKLLEGAGYEIVRWFFEMDRPALDDLPPPADMPDGLELRPVTPDHHLAIWRANREAFRDHWGGSDESEAAMRRFFDGPAVDPALWLIAWDGTEIAGGVINTIRAEENEALGMRRGWLDSVFTRRAWRRRGLARVLIGRSLHLLRDRGMTSAALDVDGDNPSGALGLYEGAGFGTFDRFAAFRKPMEGVGS